MTKEKYEVVAGAKITDEDIDDIVCTAFEGGICYWCGKAEVVGEYLGEYASDQISRGGAVRLLDEEEDKWHTLTKEKFLKGVEMYLQNERLADIRDEEDRERLDAAMVDADAADAIIQFALFGEIIFG